MEVQVKELIEKIKNDGVKTAEANAAKIIKDAEAKAEEIISKAKKDAAQSAVKAKEDAEKAEQSGKEALKQAGRDLLLNLQSRITVLFDKILKNEVTDAMDDKVMSEAISTLISSWKGDVSDLSVLLSEKDYVKVENALKSKLSDQIKKGFEVKASKSIDAGFLVSVKDGSAYYNFSNAGIAEVLSEYLNPRISVLLKEGVEA